MANYVSSLTGSQIDSVMQKIDQGVPEGWAVGEKNGVPVSSSSVYYHNNAKYYAALAQSAVPSGTTGVVKFDTDQSGTLSDAQKSQARKNIMAGGTNPNLLDNPFFTINQRGVTSGSSGSSAIYSVDRWMVNRCTYNFTANGCSLAWDGINSSNGQLLQRTGIKNNADIVGKYATLSAIIDGTLLQFSNTILSTTTARQQTFGNITMSFFYNSSYGYCVSIQNTSTTAVTIQAVKWEIGTVSTLPNDTAQNEALELLKCQKFYYKINGQSNANPLGFGWTGNTVGVVNIPTPVTMRANPTISVNNIGSLRVYYNGTYQTVTQISLRNRLNNGIAISCTNTNIPSGHVCVLGVAPADADCYIAFSADL